MSSTQDANPGDVIHVGQDRRLVVVDNQPEGLACVWYTPEGLGPYSIVLPHAKTFQSIYEPEKAGQSTSWWDTHPDMTGKYGEI